MVFVSLHPIEIAVRCSPCNRMQPIKAYFFFYTGIAGTTIPNPVFESDDRARYDVKVVSL